MHPLELEEGFAVSKGSCDMTRWDLCCIGGAMDLSRPKWIGCRVGSYLSRFPEARKRLLC